MLKKAPKASIRKHFISALYVGSSRLAKLWLLGDRLCFNFSINNLSIIMFSSYLGHQFP
ncbi:hypothetical protein SAMN05421638_1138 [Kaistella treverensis]|uniref:Uncharacterized protein n=1 Tax=Kaistella treverensis TaxID=631455 RepID=A0A1I3LHQ9_9FLAO|nr:hypothetical protein SAMN05421638_1138 [Kaistella treverensis]